MGSDKGYKLCEGVQVRREKFGLLFYDYRGPRLYFLPSGALLSSSFFNGTQSVSKLVMSLADANSWPRQWVEDRVAQIFVILENKGLIYEQSICRNGPLCTRQRNLGDDLQV
jgi:putative mycofactocin binding protein MftB